LNVQVEEDSVSITINDADINFRYVTFTLNENLLPQEEITVHMDIILFSGYKFMPAQVGLFVLSHIF